MSWLATWRKRAKLTQQALADQVGIKQSSLSSIEIGAALPSVTLFHQLIDATGPTADEIADAVEQMRAVKKGKVDGDAVTALAA